MKTLTEKYNAVLEGTFPKKQFVRDAKLSHPNFITQFTSYEDAVKILKNKGLVHENKKEEVDLNLPPTTLDKAIKYELEKAGVDYLMAAPDTDEYLKAKAKAEKALVKDRLYYLELNTSKKKRTDVMEPVTAKNVVDKGNEMKKVKTVKENIFNTAQMGGVTTSKGTSGYIDNPTPGTYNKEDALRDLVQRATNQVTLKYSREIANMSSEELEQFLQGKGIPQQVIDNVVQEKVQASNETLKEVIKQIIKNSLNEESHPFRLMATRLLDTLSTAIDAAERVGTAAEMDRDNVADDPEVVAYTEKVEDALKRIYNGYMTGNREDDRSGEIFK